jgi:hypothetical protein
MSARGQSIPEAMSRARSSIASKELRSALQALLDSLAPLLLRSRLTPAVVEELARLAFVRAAAADARMQSGRINHSRIATLTGLSRVEVRRLLAAPRHASAPPPRQLDRAERVLEGWSQDSLFRTSQGVPRALPLHGPAPSFDELVRRYSGDMPAASVRKELLRIGAITVREDVVRLVRRRVAATSARGPDPLVELVPYLRSVLEALQPDRAQLAWAHQLSLPVQTELDAALTTTRARRTLAAAVAAIEPRRSRARNGVATRKGSRPAGHVGITVLITHPNTGAESGEDS